MGSAALLLYGLMELVGGCLGQRRRRVAVWRPQIARISSLSLLTCCALAISADAIAAQNQRPRADAGAAETEEFDAGARGTDTPAKEQQQDQGLEALPTLDELLQQLPKADQLLQDPAVDWIILKGDPQRVLIARPVYPRPDTLAKLEQARDALPRGRAADPEENLRRQQRREELEHLSILLPDLDDRKEYRLPVNKVENIIYHEELILRRIDELLDQNQFPVAFELLFWLQRNVPDWPGVKRRLERLLYAEAKSQFDAGELDSALFSARRLHDQSPGYNGLHELIGTICNSLISEAAKSNDYQRARHYLQQLERMKPGHSVAAQWSGRLQSDAIELQIRAREAAQNGRRQLAAELIERAASIWPSTPDLREEHRRYLSRFQRLHVGVVDLAGGETPYFLPTAADRRHRHLTRVNLFEVVRIDQTAHYRSRFFEFWEPTDLGRRTDFTLRMGRAYWECHPVVTATSVVDSLAARLDRGNAAYDERFASYVKSLSVHSPFLFQVQFTHVPLTIESLFTVPVVAWSGDSPAVETSTDAAESFLANPAENEILSPRFRLHEQEASRAVYRRARPEPDDVPQHHVAEVIERKYGSYEEAVQGLLRGEVSVLPHIRPGQVGPLFDDERFFVQPYSLPVTHVLQFNPRSEVLANREVRRALFYAIDRRKILDEIVLQKAAPEEGRIVTGPFATESYAYNSLIEPREFDRALALTLALAARKQLQRQIPDLKLLCAPDPAAQAATAEIIADWNSVGITARLISASDEPAGLHSDRWDIVYRTVRMTDPIVDLWPFLALQSQARVGAIMHLPDWLRQQLFSLERSGDWNSAVIRLQELHRQLWAEMQLIPLWEVDDHIVLRKTIRGFRQRPIYAYQDIERWIVQPWYPVEETQ